MLVRNLLKAGDFVEPLPQGIPVTLQYKPTGNLEKVLIGFDVSAEGVLGKDLKVSDNLYRFMIQKDKVPVHVSSHDGTVFVQGIVYTGKPVNQLGYVPFDQIEEILEDIRNGLNFNFFAANVISQAVTFSGAAQIRSWMKTHGFNVIPGYIVPQGDSELAIRNLLDSTPFKYEHICGYFIFNRNTFRYQFLGHKLSKITQIQVYLDHSGYIGTNINLEDKSLIHLSYYDMMCLDLHSNDFVLVDSNLNILSKYPNGLTSDDMISYTCPFCGKVYTVEDEFSRCPDPHCFSKIYLDIVHFLTSLNLKIIEYEDYLEAVNYHEIEKFSDILLMDDYKDILIQTSIYEIINAVVPVADVRNREVIWDLCSACNNSEESIRYYLTHPLCIYDDLGIDSTEFVEWLQDGYNVKTIFEIIQYSNVDIVNMDKKFDGSPIFRDKQIYLTGQFLHGSYSEVEAILRSYSATIVDADFADCGIIGDIPEGINGAKINLLKSKGLPIFSESDFFNLYEIDSDLV